MGFVPLLVGGLIGWAASKIGGGDDNKATQQAAQPNAAADLPKPPTPAPEAQSQAAASAGQVQQKARRRAAAGSTAMVQPRTARRGAVAGPSTPQASGQPLSLLGG